MSSIEDLPDEELERRLEVPTGRPQEHSDQDLLDALREVSETAGVDDLSMRDYDDERPDGAPSSRTISKRLGSWSRAKRLLEEVDQ